MRFWLLACIVKYLTKSELKQIYYIYHYIMIDIFIMTYLHCEFVALYGNHFISILILPNEICNKRLTFAL